MSNPTPYSKEKVQAVSATAASVRLSGKASKLILSSTTDCYINFNAVAVKEEGLYLPADQPVTVDLYMHPQLSVIQDTAPGFLTVLELAGSVLFNRVRGWFTSNASLLLVGNTTFYGDSTVIFDRTIAGTATGNSSLKKVIAGSTNANASMKAVISGTVTGDCDLIP